MKNKENYKLAMNRVMDYIDQNSEKSLTVSELSNLVGYSSFHFHRLFHSITNESLHQYILRIRLEKAALSIQQKKMSLTEIALSGGFYDSAAFSKHFKRHFGQSPSDYRKNRKNIQEKKYDSSYNKYEDLLICWDEFTIKEAQQKLFYERFQGDFRGDFSVFMALYKKIISWKKKQKNQNDFNSKNIVIYHDPLEISPDKKLRISVGVTMPVAYSDLKMNSLLLQGGLYKVFNYIVKGNHYEMAWKHAYVQIIKQTSLILREDYAYEVYPENCYDNLKNQTSFQIWIPVKKQ
jgi:AraC family transcriptional regulator